MIISAQKCVLNGRGGEGSLLDLSASLNKGGSWPAALGLSEYPERSPESLLWKDVADYANPAGGTAQQDVCPVTSP